MRIAWNQIEYFVVVLPVRDKCANILYFTKGYVLTCTKFSHSLESIIEVDKLVKSVHLGKTIR